MRSLQVAPRLLSAGILALFLSACGLKTAPDRETLQQENLPNLKLPAAWVESSATGPVQDNWIATLGDPQLSALVVEAITYNADLRLAVARVEEAAANVKAAGAQLYSFGEPARKNWRQGRRRWLGRRRRRRSGIVGNRPVGPRALRPGSSRRPICVDRG
jgi:hypothetical protein